VTEGAGPRSILLAAVGGAREELLAAVALVPAEERETRPLVGDWTLKDLLGHVADWEQFEAEGLQQVAAGRVPEVGAAADFQVWNEVHSAARRGQPWARVWADFRATHQVVLAALEGISEADLRRPFRGPGDEVESASLWGRGFARHERAHAADLRAAFPAR
jgi:hypothetical protein